MCRNCVRVGIVALCLVVVALLVLPAPVAGVVVDKRVTPAHTSTVVRLVLVGGGRMIPVSTIVSYPDAFVLRVRVQGGDAERDYTVTRDIYEGVEVGSRVNITRGCKISVE